MAAVSMHGSENAFGGMNSGLNRRLSPAFHSLASPLRQRHFDLEKLRELARSDEFSDSESDGVDSDEEDDDVDVADTMLVPYRRPSPKRKAAVALRRQQKSKDAKAGGSPKGDEWELVDKSPTFESVAEGKTELGGESWFVQEQEQ
ncbi:hypothetical protein PF005_g29923 [Phytophthora fragariae]|uniref:Uncharacterized protein n=1 Tax=Phytophthora fragariae TaxID=53985 RepID=A0A6A3H483_9STRA|nr:hypothetical protein PF003_g7665 [Phytophthora fragariae]KAE8919408.1 hypothetical protein PF009_g30286 [Phytophthora fragariae]KAE8963987.1 hypothetical protein PF011_g28832 [Phytophthora fragariae]KAE9061947.1 hypothetical protein PF010_g29616 [Phytophthora fragariae]KAE9062984.1 hypothetical protein PF007_g29716 [Phytophthora fragariae]